MSYLEFLRESVDPYRKLLRYLTPYRARFIWGVIFGALFGVMNGVLIYTIKHVSEVVFPNSGDTSSSLLASVQGQEGAIGLEQVMLACMIIPVIMGVRGLLSYLNAYCMLWVSLRVLSDIRIELFSKLLDQSLGYFGRSKSGELIQTVFNMTRLAQMALTTVSSDMIKQPFSILSALAVLFYIDWKFTLVALTLFPVCIVPVLIIGKRVRQSGGKEESEAGMLMVVMQEAFAGVRVVKSHAREDYERQRFTSANASMMKFIMRWQKAMEMIGPMVETFASIGVAMALVYAWWLNLGAASFLALNAGLVLLYPPFKTLSRIYLLLQKCIVATSKIFSMMEEVPEIQNVENPVKLDRVQGNIRFENMTFSYGPGLPAVQNIDLSIEPGRTYALVGVSGAGKSTLLSLILRFYDPEEGRVLLDGVDLRNIDQHSLRQHIGIVNQDTFLFHDTIYNNIRYGKLDATKEEIETAAKQAFAHDFILAQPSGYDTQVGDKGCLISGGQQQRISIARAILRNAPILLLDEATSALDSESETKIQAALETLSQGKTVVAIAHRLSTILGADQIVVMDKGKITEVGTHAELLQSSPQYQTLYNLQFRQLTE